MPPKAPPSFLVAAPQRLVPLAALKVRPSVQQSNIAELAAAYTTMQGRSESDNRSWIYWAEFHGFNRNDCWHHGEQGGHSFPYDLFLPWHRAYLHSFEQVAFANSPGVALPWWDWTSPASHQEGIPASFKADGAGGTQNPLASGPLPANLPMRPPVPPRTSRRPGPPDRLPRAQTIDEILDIPSFGEFSEQLQNQHDAVHGWTGGQMGVVATAAFDPIFWSHHAMIDRLWYLWQLRHGVQNIPPNYLNLVLAPWNLTVKDVLAVSALGYTYGVSRVLLPSEQFNSSVLEPQPIQRA